ncbi:MAG: MFS transporter [Myxococcales bacterium]|nr:MFS transporter [Myxococcales bacterium]
MASTGSPSLLRRFVDLRPGEWRIASMMFTYFFLVITSFWILKPIKKTLFLGYYANQPFSLLGADLDGPAAEQLAKVLNLVIAALAAAAFSMLSRRFRRQQLTYVFSFFFLAGYGVFGLALENPNATSVWSFYLFGDLFSTLMVATFFAFLNDSVTPDAAKRLFGIVGFGGVLGGVVGSTVVASLIGTVATTEWLMIAGGIGVAILVVAWGAGRSVAPHADEVTRPASEPEPASEAGSAAIAGARLVFRSPYLLAIVAVVGLYEIVSTILDYQFTTSIVHFVEDEAAQRQHFASVFAVTNWVSMLVQLFLTSFVMRRFGLGVALLILPFSILAASSGFLILPSLWIASALNTADNGFSYSINQSAKEALYVPTTKDEKYQAKAFIDMFVQRFAKAVAVGISLTITTLFPEFEAVRWLTLMVIPVLLIWAGAAAFAGRRFAVMAEAAANPRG